MKTQKKESIFKNCIFRCEVVSGMIIKNYYSFDKGILIKGVCLDIADVVAIDTIENVVITKTIADKYKLYLPVRKFMKRYLKDLFKFYTLGQYQIIIWKTYLKYEIYFIAPPPPNSKFYFKFRFAKYY
jgi:hypothetical protein